MKRVLSLIVVIAMIAAMSLLPSFAEEQTVSELFWIAKVTVGAGGEVKDAEGIDFGTTDKPATQASLAPRKYVTHVSYDELRPGVVCNQAANGDKLITLPSVAAGTTELLFWGWIGAAGDIENFSYSVDGGEKVEVGKYDTEEGVRNAAFGVPGTTDASRFSISVPVDGDGTYVVRVYANVTVEVEEPLDPSLTIVPELFWDATLTVGAGTAPEAVPQESLLPGKYVTHVSYDEVKPGIVCSKKDENITTPVVASGTKEVIFWGWVAAAGEIIDFSYSINDGELQSVGKYPTEDAVKDAANDYEGSVDASRFEIKVPISADGTYSVKLYVNVAVEVEDEPSDPTDTPSDPTDTPSDPTDTPSDPTDKPANPGTGDNAAALFVLVLMGAAAVLSVAVVMKKKSYEK